MIDINERKNIKEVYDNYNDLGKKEVTVCRLDKKFKNFKKHSFYRT